MVIKILKSEIRHNLLPVVSASFIVIFTAYFIFGTNNLSDFTVAVITERILTLSGIYASGILFYPESIGSIKDILIMRKTDLGMIYLLRYILYIMVWILFTVPFLIIITGNLEQPETGYYILHSISIALIIGSVCMLIFSLTGSISLDFFGGIFIVLIQWFFRNSLKGLFNLYSLPNISYNKSIILIIISFIITAISVRIWKRRVI